VSTTSRVVDGSDNAVAEWFDLTGPGYPGLVRPARQSVFTRVRRFVRQLFSSGPPPESEDDDLEGGVGVREPRRPLRPTSSGAVALEAPPEEKRDVRAIGEDRD
jgi:hypothetical protein